VDSRLARVAAMILLFDVLVYLLDRLPAGLYFVIQDAPQ